MFLGFDFDQRENQTKKEMLDNRDCNLVSYDL